MWRPYLSQMTIHGNRQHSARATAGEQRTTKRPSIPGLAEFRGQISERTTSSNSYVLLLGLRTFDSSHLLRALARGLPYATIERFRRNAAISQDALLEWLQLAPRTLTRRKQQGRFAPDESDRLLRAARLFGRALELFEGNRDAATEWLFRAQPALGGAK